MQHYKVSPKYYNTDFPTPTTDDLIIIFEDRVLGWHLNWGEHLNYKDYEHAGFAVLLIGFAYFESIAIFRNGEDSEKKGKKFFIETFEEVFAEMKSAYSAKHISEAATLMWQDGRCGFYHFGMTKKGIVLQDKQRTEDLTIRLLLNESNQVSFVLIDRHGFISAIQKHFGSYIKALKDSGDDKLKKKFQAAWDIMYPKPI